MRITAGSVQASRKARTPVTISSSGSALPPICAPMSATSARLELLVHGAEQVALVGEVVVERAARDAARGRTISSVPTPA